MHRAWFYFESLYFYFSTALFSFIATNKIKQFLIKYILLKFSISQFIYFITYNIINLHHNIIYIKHKNYVHKLK